MKKIFWIIFAILCILIGLYPFAYVFLDMGDGLLSSKSDELLSNTLWNITFYGHIVLGGIALMIGWLQFSEKLRDKNISLHRLIGRIYVIFAIISSLCSLYIGIYATGGMVSIIGFLSLGVIWFATTLSAYLAVKNKNIQLHKDMMIYSYAACFAAVTLRLWLPILVISIGDFIPAYRIVAWLCWVPNLVVAYFIVSKSKPTIAAV